MIAMMTSWTKMNFYITAINFGGHSVRIAGLKRKNNLFQHFLIEREYRFLPTSFTELQMKEFFHVDHSSTLAWFWKGYKKSISVDDFTTQLLPAFQKWREKIIPF